MEETPPAATTDAAPPATPEASGGLGEERSLDTAGFAFRPAMQYSLDFAGDSVTLSAGERSDAPGTLILLRAETDPALIDATGDGSGRCILGHH